MEDNLKTSNNILSRIASKWKTRLLLEAAWVLLLITLLSYAIIHSYEINRVFLLPAAFCFAIMLWFIYSRDFPTRNDLIRLIDEQFAKAEYSTSLLYRNPENLLESIQKKKLEDHLQEELPGFRFPVSQKKSFTIVSVFIMMTLTVILPEVVKYENNNSNTTPTLIQNIQSPVGSSDDSLFLSSLEATIFPPGYTSISAYKADNLNLEIPSGSRVKFTARFNQTPDKAWIDYSTGDSIVFQNNEAWYKPDKNSFYSVYFSLEEKTGYSPLFSTQLLKDRAPEINIEGLPAYQNLEYTELSDFSFSTKIEDDYGIQDVYMIATITKGSGEAIKFREQKIPVPFEKGKNNLALNPEMPVESFEMEPGNELYFYLAAVDNRQPEAQISRSESFFYIVEDTANVEFSLQGNLGVDLMPQYFKSQLQIIIDTKELIEEKALISKKEFNKRSNELAHDQKDLRLKYGQFIGEESESGIEAERETQPDGSGVAPDGDNVLSEFGHDHDHENEKGQLMDKGTHNHDEHEHEHSEKENENPLTEFVHSHEDRETATFYAQSLKSKLKSALSEMWDAELYLRLYDPQSSLPYQYKAYKLIKEIRNHARVYVRRIGFEPPAINEKDARLDKNAEDLFDNPFYASASLKSKFKATKTLIRQISENKLKSGDVNTLKGQLDNVAEELAEISTESNPGQFLEELIILRGLKEKNIFNSSDVYNLQVLKNRLSGMATKERSPASRQRIESIKLMKDFKNEIAQ